LGSHAKNALAKTTQARISRSRDKRSTQTGYLAANSNFEAFLGPPPVSRQHRLFPTFNPLPATIITTFCHPSFVVSTTANMAWRNQGITGSNNIPLGKRRFGNDADDSANKNGTESTNNNGSVSNGSNNGDIKRGRSPERTFNSHHHLHATDSDMTPGSDADGTKRRRKRHRWGDATENKAAGLMGLPTAILADMTSEQLEAYTLHLRIEEITQKLKINDVVPADKDRYDELFFSLLTSKS
jgi:hypothetical protein